MGVLPSSPSGRAPLPPLDRCALPRHGGWDQAMHGPQLLTHGSGRVELCGAIERGLGVEIEKVSPMLAYYIRSVRNDLTGGRGEISSR